VVSVYFLIKKSEMVLLFVLDPLVTAKEPDLLLDYRLTPGDSLSVD